MIVVSWNVLADSYLRPQYYPRVDPALLQAGARTDAIVEQVARFDARLICLQEVEPALTQALRSRGLTVHFAQKIGRPDGCAIVGEAGGFRTLAFSDGAPDRPDSGHIALLAEIDGLIIATTHLRWDQRGTAAADRWAVRQARQLLAEKPDVVCGDFNFEPDDEVYELFRAAGLTDAALPVPTANPNGKAKRIDYLWCSEKLRAEALPVSPVKDDTILPSRALPSDHVPVGARFTRVRP